MKKSQLRHSLSGRMGVSVLLWAVATLSPLALSAGERSDGYPAEKVRVAYSSLSGNMGPLWLAHEHGLFRKFGLEVEPVFIASGATSVQALVAGDVALAQMAGAGIIQSGLRGADVVMIAGLVNTLTFQLFVARDVSQPERLKGKSVAVTRFGSSTDFAMRYALDKWGLVPPRDVTIKELETMPAMVEALEAGRIQGAMLSAPSTLKARKSGLRVLADLQMLGLEYQHTSIATTRVLIKTKPELVRRFMKAYVEAIHRYKTNRTEALAVLAKYLKTDDADVLAETYETIGLTLIPEKPYPTLRGIQIMLRELAVKEPQAREARAEQFVDTSFVRELDSSGYIDRLYRPQPAVARSEGRSTPSPSTTPQQRSQPTGQVRTALVVAKSVPAAVNNPRKVDATRPRITEGLDEYIVKLGDTLSRIALRFYGTAFNWVRIYEANRSIIKNPNFIYVGQRIMIPPAAAAETRGRGSQQRASGREIGLR